MRPCCFFWSPEFPQNPAPRPAPAERLFMAIVGVTGDPTERFSPGSAWLSPLSPLFSFALPYSGTDQEGKS